MDCVVNFETKENYDYRLQDFWRTPTIAMMATITFAFTGALAAQDMRAPRLAHPPRAKSSVSSGAEIQSQRAVPSVAPAALNDTTWTNIGPAPVTADPAVEATPDSGRVNGIAAHPTDPNTIYVAASGGGVWKTTNGGTNWTPLSDTQKTLAMGAIAMAPSDLSRDELPKGAARSEVRAVVRYGWDKGYAPSQPERKIFECKIAPRLEIVNNRTRKIIRVLTDTNPLPEPNPPRK